METTQFSKKYALECEYLHGCFSGSGATNKKFVEILTSNNSEELKLIRRTYSALYNHDLLHLLFRAQRNSKLFMAAYLRMSEQHERDAEIVRGALFGSIVDLNIVIEILCARSSSDLQHVQQAYRSKYNLELERDISLKTNGNFKEIFCAILNSSRINGARVDSSMAMCDAKVIYEAMESGKSIDQKTILAMISRRSTGQFKAVLLSYKQLYGHDFFKSLKRAKSGEFGKELHIIIKCIQYPEKHFAKQLLVALRNSNAQDVLIRIIITRSGIDIKGIKSAFSAKTGWSLESLIRSEFSNTEKANGLAADLLVALVKQ